VGDKDGRGYPVLAGMSKASFSPDPECARTTPSMYFWYRQMLKASDRIEDSGPPVLGLSLPFFLSWCLVGAFVINGLKSTGKVNHHFLTP
jgi:hypothetical protein